MSEVLAQLEKKGGGELVIPDTSAIGMAVPSGTSVSCQVGDYFLALVASAQNATPTFTGANIIGQIYYYLNVHIHAYIIQATASSFVPYLGREGFAFKKIEIK